MNVNIQLESLKILSIIEEAIGKLRFLDTLPFRSGNEMNEMLGEEINRIMREQRALEETYAKLITQRSELKGLSNKRKLTETQTQIREVAKLLRDSTKKLCRVLKENPDATDNMEKIKNNKNKVCEQLEDLVEELRNGSYKNFRIDIEKEKNELDKLDSLKNEEKDLNKAIRKINSEYKKAEEEFENEEEENNEEIKRLKKDLNMAKTAAELEKEYEIKQIAGREACLKRQHDAEENNLQKRIEFLQERQRTEKLVNQKIKEFLSKKKDDYKAKNDEWEEQTEEEVKKLDDKITGVLELKELDKERMEENQAKLQTEEEEEKLREIKEQNDLKEKQRLIDLKDSKWKAAKYIQWKWEQYKINSKGKKGKKKKKKGKKKKKK